MHADLINYGYNRLIVGYHWATDIEATRILSSALVARLHADPDVRQLIASAAAEYRQVTTGITPAPQGEGRMAPAHAYRLNGIATTDSTRGIVVENGKKTVKKY